MTADKRADILSLARKTIHTEALALKHLEQTLGDDFVCAVELILHSRGKLVVTGMYNRGIQMYRFPNSDVQKSVIFEGIKKRLKIV